MTAGTRRRPDASPSGDAGATWSLAVRPGLELTCTRCRHTDPEHDPVTGDCRRDGCPCPGVRAA